MSKIDVSSFKRLSRIQVRKLDTQERQVPNEGNPFLSSVLGLKLGEGILVSKKKWNKKSNPYTLFIASSNKKRDKKFKISSKIMPDKSAWLLKRVS